MMFQICTMLILEYEADFPQCLIGDHKVVKIFYLDKLPRMHRYWSSFIFLSLNKCQWEGFSNISLSPG